MRETSYKPEYDAQVEKLCLLGGFTDKQIADFFDVTEQTINNWKNEFPSFFDSIKAGKEIADAKVSESLYKRVLGYEHKEDIHLVVSDGAGVGSHVEKHEAIKRYPPDATSMIFWLKNRRPKEWRDKQEFEHSGSVGIADALMQARKRISEPEST